MENIIIELEFYKKDSCFLYIKLALLNLYYTFNKITVLDNTSTLKLIKTTNMMFFHLDKNNTDFYTQKEKNISFTMIKTLYRSIKQILKTSLVKKNKKETIKYISVRSFIGSFIKLLEAYYINNCTDELLLDREYIINKIKEYNNIEANDILKKMSDAFNKLLNLIKSRKQIPKSKLITPMYFKNTLFSKILENKNNIDGELFKKIESYINIIHLYYLILYNFYNQYITLL
jgi:hypothetical protein